MKSYGKSGGKGSGTWHPKTPHGMHGPTQPKTKTAKNVVSAKFSGGTFVGQTGLKARGSKKSY